MQHLKNEVSASTSNIIDYQPYINMVKDDFAKTIEELSTLYFNADQKLKFKSDISDVVKLE